MPRAASSSAVRDWRSGEPAKLVMLIDGNGQYKRAAYGLVAPNDGARTYSQEAGSHKNALFSSYS